MKNGTIEHTDYFQAFRKYVLDKFETMSNFSMILYGDPMKLTSIERKVDNIQTWGYITQLKKIAEQLPYDKSKVFISAAEILEIQSTVHSKIKNNDCTKKAFFEFIGFDLGKFNRIINGNNPYKNEAYQQLINILGL